MLLGLAMVSLPISAATGQPGTPATPAGEANELVGRLQALTDELAHVDAELSTTAADLATGEAQTAKTSDVYETAVHARDAAVERLARYSVSAYIGGDAIDASLTDAVLRASSVELDAEARHALAVTVRQELLRDARQSLDDLNAATHLLDHDEAVAGDARRRLDELHVRQSELRVEIERSYAAIAEALAAEERARESESDKARARRLDLRPGTHRPLSVHSGVVPPPSVRPEVTAKLAGEIPPIALDAYWRAATLTNTARPDCAIDWALIGAVGKVETSHGTYGGTTVATDGSTSPTILGIPLDGSSGIARIDDTDGGALDGDPEFDRAVGPMQFIPSTWRGYAADGNGDGIADPHNLYDAAVAAGTYLCRSAAGPITDPTNASRAVYAYNHSVPYNVEVLTLADHYRRVLNPSLAPPTTPPPVPIDPGELPPPASPGDPTTTTTSTSTPATSSTTTTSTTAVPPPP